MKDKLQGEGDYRAAQRFNQRSREFVSGHDVEQLGRDAAPESPEEAAELRNAEREGKARAAGHEHGRSKSASSRRNEMSANMGNNGGQIGNLGGSVTADRIQDFAEKVEDQGREAIDRGSSEVRRLLTDVEDLIKKVAHVNDEDIARVRDKATQTLAATRRTIEENAARVRAGGRQVADRADTYVHDRPWTALGIAAAVGVLLGVLSARR